MLSKKKVKGEKGLPMTYAILGIDISLLSLLFSIGVLNHVLLMLMLMMLLLLLLLLLYIRHLLHIHLALSLALLLLLLL